MAKLLELLDEDYRIANKISTDTNVHTPLNSIENFKKKYMPFLSNFPEESPLRKDAILEIKIAIQNQHNNGEALLTPSGEINDTKFNEVTTASCKELQKKYLNIDFSNLSSVAQQYQQQYDSEVQKRESENSLKENIDFSKPEEAKKYFDDFYKNFANCKTREEKLKSLEGLGISLRDMVEEQQDEFINKFDTRIEIREIKENLRTKFQEENPNLQDEEFEQALEDVAVEQYSIENNKDFETEKNTNNMMIQLETYLLEIGKLKQDISNCHDENKKKDLEEKLSKLEEEKALLTHTLSLTKDEIAKITKASMEQGKDTRLSKTEKSTNELEDNQLNDDLSDLFTTDETELDNDLSDLFDPKIDEVEEDLSDLFTAKESSEIEENSNNKQPINEDNPAFVNPILINVKKDDLKQEDYTFEVEEKESLWNKLKNGFSKIKNVIVEKLGLNKVKLLNHQKYLNIAENNTKTTEMHSENKHSFEESLIVSKEEQEKYRKEYETSKNVTQKNTSEIHTNDEQNISF